MHTPTTPKPTAPTSRCAHAQPGAPHDGVATPQASLGPAVNLGTRFSRPTGVAPIPTVFHTHGTLCSAPWYGGTTYVPRQ